MTAQIPRIVHAFWGGSPLPDEWGRCLDRWRRLHPDWEVIVWAEGQIPDLGGLQRFWGSPEVWSPKSNIWQHRTNLLRYVLLAKHGGVWVDVDMEPLRPIDPLIDGETRMLAGWEADGHWINNAFLASPPGHPAVAEILDGLADNIADHPEWRSNRQSGARYITPILAGRLDVRVLPQAEIYPYHWSQTADVPVDGGMADRFPDAWTVHHWANRRRREAP